MQRLEESLNELTQIVKNKEYLALKQDSKDLKKTQELLDPIKIKVEEVKTVLDQDTMEEVVVVKYSVPDITLRFDDNGDPIKNDMFFALNSLNLVSLEDMDKIRKNLDEQKIKYLQK